MNHSVVMYSVLLSPYVRTVADCNKFTFYVEPWHTNADKNDHGFPITTQLRHQYDEHI